MMLLTKLLVRWETTKFPRCQKEVHQRFNSIHFVLNQTHPVDFIIFTLFSVLLESQLSFTVKTSQRDACNWAQNFSAFLKLACLLAFVSLKNSRNDSFSPLTMMSIIPMFSIIISNGVWIRCWNVEKKGMPHSHWVRERQLLSREEP